MFAIKYIWLIVLINIINISMNQMSKEYKQKYLEEIRTLIKKYNLEVNNKDQISQKDLIKIIRYIFGQDIDPNSKAKKYGTSVEQEFMYNIIKKLTLGLPSYIDISSLPDLLDSKKLETITNDMLKDFDLNKLQKDISTEVEKLEKQNTNENKKDNKNKKEDDILDL